MTVDVMSDAKGQQHEPSMEEILASIRRIIAEDGDTTAPAVANAAVPAAAPVEPADDILELTEVVEPDVAPVKAEPAPPPPPPPPPPPRPPVREVAPVVVPPSDGERIVSAATAAASVAAFSQIATLRHEQRDRDVMVGAGHLTLEMLVREELRPILKDWLDRYLPDMVERLVQEEITRLVRDVQRR
jgi:cell pole-organizing protein PopZ